MRAVRAVGLTALAGIGALLVVRRWCVSVTVRGHSMTPTLADGQRLLAIRRRRYRVGDIVVFRIPDGRGTPGDPDYRVKRIVAVAGDPRPATLADGWLPDPVPPGRVAVAGDNAAHSQDSRHLGYIALAEIRGRVRV